MRLTLPKANSIEQGSIFSCARAPSLPHCQSWGIVMTARCDLEHRKNSAVNYLPIIRFQDYLTTDFVQTIARRSIKQNESDIHKALKQKEVTDGCLSTYPLRTIIDRETTSKQRQMLLDKLDFIEAARAIIIDSPPYAPKQVSTILVNASKPANTLITELIKQQLPEHYFLEAVDTCGKPSEGYVILLRHMMTMPTNIMARVGAGITKEQADSIPNSANHLSFDHEPISMVLGVLRSPDMEHLAQHYASLFVRVGLEDQRNETIDSHIAFVETISRT
jgi:hypothetical protein